MINIQPILTIISFVCSVSLFAQATTTTSGGEANGSGGTVSYTIGQVAYTQHTGSNGTVAQGVQHAYEIYTLSTGEIKTDISLSFYPNPTEDYLNLKVNSVEPLSYQLFDIQGKLLKKGDISANSTQISMNDLATSIYFIKVTRRGTLMKTFKVIKK